MSKIENHHVTQYNDLFGTLQEQVKTIQIFSQIEKMRKHTLLLNCTDQTLPGGPTPGPCTFDVLLNGATDVVH